MISQNAKAGFDSLLKTCLDESLKTSEHADWRINQVNDSEVINENEFMMLTISSFTFRIFTLLHFTNNPVLSEYVAGALKLKPEALDRARLYDFLGEVGNSFCGIFKRELGKYFPHLGMSTPNLLPHPCLKHIEDMQADYVTHLHAKSRDKVSVFGSLYVISGTDIDFQLIKRQEASDVETGALELF